MFRGETSQIRGGRYQISGSAFLFGLSVMVRGRSPGPDGAWPSSFYYNAMGAARHASGIPNESTNCTASWRISRQSLSTSRVMALDFKPEGAPRSRYQPLLNSISGKAKKSHNPFRTSFKEST